MYMIWESFYMILGFECDTECRMPYSEFTDPIGNIRDFCYVDFQSHGCTNGDVCGRKGTCVTKNYIFFTSDLHPGTISDPNAACMQASQGNQILTGRSYISMTCLMGDTSIVDYFPSY